MALANHQRAAWRVLRLIRQRVPGAVFVVPSTVLEELGHLSNDFDNTERQRLASEALGEIGSGLLPDFRYLNLTDEQLDRAERAARRLCREKLLPPEEWHDACIICEAAVSGCAYLLTEDTHLLGISKKRLGQVLFLMGLPAPDFISCSSALT
jgi:rRNA-processing protein FCF1